MQSKFSILGEKSPLNMSRKTGNVVDLESSNSILEECLQEEEMDIPEIVEEIIELLLSGLRDTVCLQGEILIIVLIIFLCISNSLL